MAQQVVCPRCHLKHDPRPDGRCPRCHASDAAPSGSPASARPAQRRALTPARPRSLGTGPGVAVAALLVVLLLLGAALLAQRYGRSVVESRRLAERTRPAYPDQLEPLPDVDGDRFFGDQHRRCFAEAYAPSWLWNRLDRRRYLSCLEHGYAERLAKVAALGEPEWGPHTDPRWGRLEYSVHVREGRLPQKPGEKHVEECPGQGLSWGDGPTDLTFFEPTGEGTFRTSTLVYLREPPCTVRISLTWDRWALGEPLTVTNPTPDPALLRAREEDVRRKQETDEKSLACVEQVVSGWPQRPAVPPDLPIGRAVAALRAPDVRSREDALRELKQMGTVARPVVPAVVAMLTPGYDQTKGYVVETMAALDPAGEEVRPVLACLLEQPSPTVRQAAAVALAKMGDAAGPRALAAEMESPEPSTRLSAARQIRWLGERGRGAREALVKHLASDPSADVRKECAAALPWIDPDSEAVLRALEAARGDADEGVRAQIEVSIPDIERAKGRRRLEALQKALAP